MITAGHMDSGSMAGLVLRTGGGDLLVPNKAVAEIIAYRQLTPVEEDVPPWLSGNLDWRERLIPVVSIAAAGPGGKEVPPGNRARLVICHTPNGTQALPFIAFLSTAPPRLARFHAQALEPSESVTENPFVLHRLTYAERTAWIPDMDAITRAALEASTP